MYVYSSIKFIFPSSRLICLHILGYLFNLFACVSFCFYLFLFLTFIFSSFISPEWNTFYMNETFLFVCFLQSFEFCILSQNKWTIKITELSCLLQKLGNLNLSFSMRLAAFKIIIIIKKKLFRLNTRNINVLKNNLGFTCQMR